MRGESIKQRAVKSVPKDAAASVAYNIDTHMTHRDKIYEFPVPWCNINWGVRGENLHDPAGVEYMLLDRRLVQDPHDQALLKDLLSNEFEIVSDDQDIMVAKRVHPPKQTLGPNPPEGECFPRPSLDQFQPDLQSTG